MFISNANSIKRDCILSPCAYAAQGLARLLAPERQPLTFLCPHTQDEQALPDCPPARRMVVFLPDDPRWLLATLQQAAHQLECADAPLPMLILCRCPLNWLWQTLIHLVANRSLLSQVRAIAADLPARTIARLLHGHVLQRYPPLSLLAEKEALIRGGHTSGLSKPELNAILDLLHGYRITERAKFRGVSQKTLYNQRISGIKKMAEHHPQLAAHFPGHPQTGNTRMGNETLSPFEREFVHAIHCQEVFPVFQPVVDGHQRLQGVEILSRWRRRGHILQPGDFLPEIHADYVWMMLTALVLQEAVKRLNQYPGEVYFAINIPSAIASHANLPRMIETARRQLHRPRCADRLVLEFAETSDFRPQGHLAATIAQLRQLGVRIFLDDCFSQSSVLFPVRQIPFSEYKLDKSIIADMTRDPHALALIKSLHYYCQLTGSRCIAEGVDSEEKRAALQAIGIDRFQGYLISPPVDATQLARLFCATD